MEDFVGDMERSPPLLKRKLQSGLVAMEELES